MHNVMLAIWNTNLICVYRWLSGQATFDVKYFNAFVVASDVISTGKKIVLEPTYIHI